MKDLEGRTAVVTGAGGGIGRSIALQLARHGVSVVVSDIEPEAAAAVAAEVERLGVAALAHTTDISSLDEVAALADAAYRRFGSVEILVNNAGVTLRPLRASWDTSYEDFKWMMDVNFWGVLHGHHVFVPRMRHTPGPKHIVSTSSLATLISVPGLSAYSASKAAVDGFCNAVREELKTQEIGLSILHPGLVRTRIVSSERLRDSSDRQPSPMVKPWSDYVTLPSDDAQPAPGPPEPEATDPDVATHPMQYISANDVGRLVVEGILENKPHILTHPLEPGALEKRVQVIHLGTPRVNAPY